MCTSLHSLQLGDNPLCNKDTDGRGSFDARGMQVICDQMPALGQVLTLGLRGITLCGVSVQGFGTFTSVGVAALCKGLRNKQTLLTSLDLSHNNLTGWTLRQGKGIPTAMQLLALALQDKSTYSLTHLYLRHCHIGPIGGKLLGDSIFFNNRLLELVNFMHQEKLNSHLIVCFPM